MQNTIFPFHGIWHSDNERALDLDWADSRHPAAPADPTRSKEAAQIVCRKHKLQLCWRAIRSLGKRKDRSQERQSHGLQESEHRAWSRSGGRFPKKYSGITYVFTPSYIGCYLSISYHSYIVQTYSAEWSCDDLAQGQYPSKAYP